MDKLKDYKQGDLYVANMTDDTWYGVCDNTRRLIEADVKKTAQSMQCAIAAIVVHPDPIFPLYGKNTPHRVFEAIIPKDVPFETQAVFTGTIAQDRLDAMSEKQRKTLIASCRDALNDLARGVPGKYNIITDKGIVLERGRV